MVERRVPTPEGANRLETGVGFTFPSNELPLGPEHSSHGPVRYVESERTKAHQGIDQTLMFTPASAIQYCQVFCANCTKR